MSRPQGHRSCASPPASSRARTSITPTTPLLSTSRCRRRRHSSPRTRGARSPIRSRLRRCSWTDRDLNLVSVSKAAFVLGEGRAVVPAILHTSRSESCSFQLGLFWQQHRPPPCHLPFTCVFMSPVLIARPYNYFCTCIGTGIGIGISIGIGIGIRRRRKPAQNSTRSAISLLRQTSL